MGSVALVCSASATACDRSGGARCCTPGFAPGRSGASEVIGGTPAIASDGLRASCSAGSVRIVRRGAMPLLIATAPRAVLRRVVAGRGALCPLPAGARGRSPQGRSQCRCLCSSSSWPLGPACVLRVVEGLRRGQVSHGPCRPVYLSRWPRVLISRLFSPWRVRRSPWMALCGVFPARVAFRDV